MNVWQTGLTILLVLAASGPATAASAGEKGPSSLPAAKPVVVMLGDSLTQGGLWADYFPEALVYNEGLGGDTVAQVTARLDRSLDFEPDLVIVMAGINDLGQQAPASRVIAGQTALWDEIERKRPGTNLAVLGLLPVIEAKTSFRVSNRTIRDINRELKKLAQARGLTFIDLYPLMADGNGALRAELTTDGVHLTPEAYAVWRKAIEPLIRPAPLEPAGPRRRGD